jgi:hypothetical protein
MGSGCSAQTVIPRPVASAAVDPLAKVLLFHPHGLAEEFDPNVPIRISNITPAAAAAVIAAILTPLASAAQTAFSQESRLSGPLSASRLDIELELGLTPPVFYRADSDDDDEFMILSADGSPLSSPFKVSGPLPHCSTPPPFVSC